MHYYAQGSDLMTYVHFSAGWESNAVITERHSMCSHSLLDLKAWNQCWWLRQHRMQMPQSCNLLAICVCWDLDIKVFFAGRGIQGGFFIMSNWAGVWHRCAKIWNCHTSETCVISYRETNLYDASTAF